VNTDEKEVAEWSDIWQFYSEQLDGRRVWIYRGISDPTYRLKTSLERSAEEFAVDLADFPAIEKNLMRWFKRRAHHFVPNVPADDDPLEWLALMQDHGAPTRLLDWSFSFLVALYFAIEKAKAGCAVWCLDLHWLLYKVEAKFKDQFKTVHKDDPYLKKRPFFDAVFRGSPPLNLVYSVNPNRLNPRRTIQQGIFLAAGNLSRSFEQNFEAIQEDERRRVSKLIIHCNVNTKREILGHLHRMNINRATLFPGLDGFSQSFKTMLAMPEILKGRAPFSSDKV